MSIEYPDVQWTVVCDGSAQAALACAASRAEAHGWRFELEVNSLEGESVPLDGTWPAETLGGGRYNTAAPEATRALFWSTYSDARRTQFTGGLYLHDFTSDVAAPRAACDQALDELRHLFDGPEVSCLALVLEDDEGINVAPGIVGVYRAPLWRAVSKDARGGVVERLDGEWVLVRPAVEGGELAGVDWMPGPVQDSLRAIEASLDRTFWSAQD